MTDQELKDLVASLAVSQAKTDEQIQELKNSQDRTNDQLQKLKESQDRTDEQLKKTDEKLDRLCKLYGNSENRKGEEVEEFFYRYFSEEKKIQNISFEKVERNVIVSSETEHDILLINGKNIALLSVKYKPKKEDIDFLIEKEMVRVRNFFHSVGSHHKIFGGVASFIVSKEVEEYAEKRGVFVFTRSGKNTKLLNAPDFVPVLY